MLKILNYRWFINKLTGWTITALVFRVARRLTRGRPPALVYRMATLTFQKQTHYLNALQLWMRLARKTYPKNPLVLIEFAQILMRRAEWLQATHVLSEVIAIMQDETPERVWFNLARAYRQLSRDAAAEVVLEKGLELRPQSFTLRLEAAKLSTQAEDWDRAADRWQQLIDQDANKASEDDWINLVRSLRLSNQAEKAKEAVEKALAVYENVWLKVESAELAMSKEEWNIALKTWQEVLKTFSSGKFPMSSKQYARFNISVLKRLVKISDYKKQINDYSAARKKSKDRQLKIAVYTSFSKGYDSLKPHEFIDERFDYFVFTDDESVDGMGIYEVRPFPKESQGLDGARAIRWPKTQPHKIFKDYDAAVWLDTSMMIVEDIYPVIDNFLKSGKAVASTPHSARQSLFEEYLACVDQGKDDPDLLKKQVEFYKKEGFDSRQLAENGFLIFNLKHPDLAPAMQTWWEQIIRFTKRDQLSFIYALNKHGVDWYHLSEPPDNIRTNRHFVITPHKIDYKILEKLVSKI